jgi:hypothetical protein
MDEVMTEHTPDQDAVTEVVAPTPVEPPAETPVKPPVKVKRKRSISTPTLYALMVVVGLVVGVGSGYAVQSERPPTPLPPLAVAQPKYPPGALFTGQLPVPLPIADDDATITNGDLTQVLLPTPIGATAIPGLDHVWQTLAEQAAYCTNQATCFTNDLADGIARIAETGWSLSDGTMEQITITQYFPGSSGKAAADYNTDGTADGNMSLTPPPGTDAIGYTYSNPDSGGSTDYMVALHGDLLIEFLVWSVSEDPDPSVINGLVSQQLARL